MASVIHVDSIVVSESDTFADFTFRLDVADAAAITVTYSAAVGTATSAANADFVSQTGPVTFAAGETVKVVRIALTNGTIVEPIESLQLSVFTPVGNVVIGNTDVIATIVDNDTTTAAPVFAVDDVIIDEAAGKATFVVRLNQAPTSAVSVNYVTTDGTASAGSDYTATSGLLTFGAGEMVKTVTVDLLKDGLAENSETFSLLLSGASGVGATLLDTQATAVIGANGQPGESLSVIHVESVVASEDAGYAEFVLRLDRPNASAVTVGYTSANGTAVASGDWLAASGSITFAAGETVQKVRVILADDSVAENTESFSLQLFSPSANALIGGDRAIATIVDDDAAPVATPLLSISDMTVDEANREAVFVVTLNRPSNGAVAANYATVDGTALAGSDYSATSGRIAFAAGEMVKTVRVALLDDADTEGSESFGLLLSGATGATASDATGTATVLANDQPALATSTVNVDDVVVGEGAGTIDFTLRLDAPATAATSVSYTTANATAAANGDYFGLSGRVTFAAGETVQTVRIILTDDSVAEPIESLTFTLFSPTANLQLGRTAALATVVDNDTPVATPGLAVGDLVIDEHAHIGTFVVRLNQASTTAVSVNYTTVDGSALAGSDYAAASGTLSFAAGETVKTVTVAVLDDAVAEDSETFGLQLSGAVGATLTDTTGQAVIGANGQAAQSVSVISVADVIVGEDAGYAELVIRLDRPNTAPVAVSYTTANGTALGTSDVIGDSGRVTFAAGETTQTVRIALVNDTVTEPIESFLVTLFTPSAGALIGNTDAVVTVIDNDGAIATPLLAVSDLVVDEGQKEAVFTVRLNRAATGAVSVNYSTTDGSAAAGSDYTASSGTLAFAAGEVVKTVRVALLDDNAVESAEAFGLTLSGAVGATLNDGTAVASIAASDRPALASVVYHVDPVVVGESDGYVDVVVRLDAPATGPVSVSYTTTANSALGTSDVLGQTGRITFAAGETVQTVRMVLVNDTVTEPVESFGFTLFSPSAGSVIGNTDTLITLRDDDAAVAAPLLAVSDPLVDEAAQELVFTVTLSQAATGPVTVNYATTNGTAVSGAAGDYLAASGTLSFATGELVKTVRVALLDDASAEASEGFGLVLSGAVGATLGDAVGHATIAESDRAALSQVAISVDDIVVGEGAGYAEFIVRLDAPSTATVSVAYTLGNQSATANGDFFGQSGVLAFAPGETVRTVRATLVNDTVTEPVESLLLTLFSPSAGAYLGNTDALATVRDNDSPSATPLLSVSDRVVDEAAHEAVFTVSLNAAASGVVSVNYTTANGSALAGSDYTAASGTLAFAAGEISQTVRVALLNDSLAETAEHFNLQLSGAVGAGVVDATGTTFIGASDAPAQSVSTVSIDPVVVAESAGYAELRVHLSAPNSALVTVAYTVAAGTAAGTSDFIAQSGTLAFAPGETEQLIRVPLVDNTTIEPIEGYTVSLFSASGNARLGNTDAVVTIVDDDALPGTPTVRVDDAYVDEASGLVVATFRLDQPAAAGTSLTYALQGLTASAGSDYNAPATGTLSFAPGETVKTVTIGLVDDTLVETLEIVDIAITGTTGLTVGDGRGHLVIAASDAAAVTTPVLNTSPGAVAEGAGYAEFTVSLSAPSSALVSVGYNWANVTATASVDYIAQSGALVFAPGETVKTVRVIVADDTTAEALESFNLTLFSPSGATLGAGIATAQILDDDSAPPATVTLSGAGVADPLRGTALADTLNGLDGNDLLDGAAGADTLVGGLGNDVYLVEDSTDVVTEGLAAGTDLVISYLDTITLAANVENLLLAVPALNGSGNALANTITGNASANDLQGGLGNDTISGAAGADTMTGGDGSDTYTVDNALDVVVETNAVAATGGTDLVNESLATYTLGANVENGRILSTGAATLTGNALNNVLIAGAGANTLDGSTGTDTASYSFAAAAVTVSLLTPGVAQATGGSGSDTLVAIENLQGSAFADRLTGDAGANQLDGLAGADTLVGGDGNDTYVVDSLADVVTEAATVGSGMDTVNTALAAYTLAANVENLRVTAATATTATGNALNNTLFSGAGNTVLDGGLGSDTASYAFATAAVSVTLATPGVAQATGGSGSDTLISIENLTGSNLADSLTGDATANVLTGNAGADTLTGGAGNDTLVGGAGNDTYGVDSTLDVISEATVSAAEIDTVLSSVTWTLGANLDNLTLTGAAAINGTGNALANAITGNAAANVINGGAGADTLTGGDGSDTYTVDHAGDVVTETNALAAGGTDLVNSLLGAYTLGANVENGRVSLATAANLSGNALANTLFAGAGDNVLDGGTGLDTVSYAFAAAAVTASLAAVGAQLTGGSGSDTLIGVENLTGSAFADSLTGDALANVLNGGAGADTLTGGDGADTYTVDNALDVVTESNALAAGGIDTVNESLTSYTLGANVEIGRILAVGAADLAGNGLSNTLVAGAGNNVLDGALGTDTVSYAFASAAVSVNLSLAGAQATGGSGSDTLISIESVTGSNFADTLVGSAAANAINGGSGADTMTGGDGNDTYTVDNAGDVVLETNAAALGGIDLVNTSLASHVLGANVENGRITATGAASLTGNVLNNVLTGGAGANSLSGDSGNDTLAGGLGLDTLNGGAGSDTFRFDTALGASNVDLVLDYSVVDDTLQLENAVFTALATPGTLGAGNFRGGAGITGAQDADDFVLYDATTGALYYDADGSGLASAAVRFGTLSAGLALTNADFSVS